MSILSKCTLLPTSIAEARLESLGDVQSVSFTDGSEGIVAVKIVSYTPAASATRHSPAEDAEVEFEVLGFAVFSDDTQKQAYVFDEVYPDICTSTRNDGGLAISQSSLDDIEIFLQEQAQAQAQSDYESRFEAVEQNATI